MRKKHANIAFFVPHLGCPHACSFCDQRAITGLQTAPAPREVATALQSALGRIGKQAAGAEIAFFGGSFTAVEPPYRRALLEAAQAFLGEGRFSGIRVSTRPDAIDPGILAELASFGVTAVELGAQSMDDGVLALANRGHTAADVEAAANLIRARGFSLGLQMMTGLPGDTPQKAWETAQRLAALRPDTLRIYPALTLEGTALEQLYNSGRYTPHTLEQTVTLCARLLQYFYGEGIRVIRLGLHDTPELKAKLVAGPYHPALRELCEGELLLKAAFAQIRAQKLPPGPVVLAVAPGGTGKMAGQRRRNLLALEQAGYPAKIQEDAQRGYLSVGVTRQTP